jgi:3-oxoacyl-[acyl-carrier-protein] synthase II
LRDVAITGLGLVCSLGTDPIAVGEAIRAGRTGISRAGDVRDRLPIPGLARCDVDCGPLLKRKKDRKLLPRAAELALVAAAAALGDDRPEEAGLFVGVGREPPDQDETEAALVAAERGGELDPELLVTRGLPLYPPLSPLRTLPNLVLAHVGIHLGLVGEAGTRAGEEAAGLAAVVEGWLAVAEGRAEVVVSGGADSRTDAGSARDLVRMRLAGPSRAPGEGAAFVRLEPLARARARGARVWAAVTAGGVSAPSDPIPALDLAEAAIGACGSAAAPLALVLALARGGSGSGRASEESGATAWIRWGA